MHPREISKFYGIQQKKQNLQHNAAQQGNGLNIKITNVRPAVVEILSIFNFQLVTVFSLFS